MSLRDAEVELKDAVYIAESLLEIWKIEGLVRCCYFTWHDPEEVVHAFEQERKSV